MLRIYDVFRNGPRFLMFGQLLKLFLYVAISLYSVAIWAFDATSLLKNSYGGLSIGAITGQFQTNNQTEVSPSSSFFYSQTSQPQLSNMNVSGTLLFGTLLQMKQIWIGPELSLNIGAPNSAWNENATLLFPTESLSTTTRSHLNVVNGGIDTRFGIALHDFDLLYARLGVAISKVSNEVIASDARPLLPLVTTVNNSFTQTIAGLRAGVGFEQFINNKISIRGDYIFTYYPSVSQTATSAENDDSGFELGPVSNMTQVQINTQSILLAIVYHWGGHE